jgi:6-phosphogluconolactonase
MMARPEIRRFADADALTVALVETVTVQLQATLAGAGSASLVVPGGRTPLRFFDQLSLAPIEWQNVSVTLTDERWVDSRDPGSNERLVRDHLVRNAAAKARVVGLKGDAPDVAAGAGQAWKRLAILARPFDVVVLGMGEDGHFASLFPGDPACARGLDLSMPPACVAARAPVAPAERVSLNLAALLQARLLVLLTGGTRKWALLQQELDDATTQHLPVRALLAQRRTALTVYWTA